MVKRGKSRRKPAGRHKGGSRRRKAGKRAGFRIRRLFLAGLGLALGFLAVWLWYLDRVITSRMEGQRFAFPSRVYARPLELYEGLRLSPGALLHELEAAGYRPVDRATGPGTFERRGDRYSIHRRAFRFPDEAVRAGPLAFDLEHGVVEHLTADGSADVAIARLDPALIGRIYPAHGEDRRFVPLERVPGLLVRTLIAVEDRDFRSHSGLDPGGIARAAWVNLREGEVVQGGSTLTQQLVKNFFLTRERTWVRKINEAFMALLLERRYDKPVILEAYLNEIYLGSEAGHPVHGIGRGAEHWFGREAGELAPHQVALLVGMIRAPAYYDPRAHPGRARERRNRVLDIMAGQGLIGAREAERYASAPLDVSPEPTGVVGRHPAFLDMVRRELAAEFRREDLQAEGLAIHTTLDPWAQHAAESAVGEVLPAVERRAGQPGATLESALVLTSANTGEVRALVGSRRSAASGFNRALSSGRPVGSLLKPVVYLRALAEPERFTLATPLTDEPVSVRLDNGDVWSPGNFENRYHGTVPLLEALAFSYNAATVRVGMELGVDEIVRTLHMLGLERDVPAYPSLLLGAAGFSVVEMAQLYQALASGGFPTRLRSVQAVLADDGRPIRRYPLRMSSIRWPGAAHLVTRALQEAVTSGTARTMERRLAERYRVAGKTGTSDGGRDAWFAGYTGTHLGVVWVGRDDNRPAGLTGAGAALPVFESLLRRLPSEPLDSRPPAGVEVRWVRLDGPALADATCPGAVRLPFVEGSAPDATAPCAGGDEREGVVEWLRGLIGR